MDTPHLLDDGQVQRFIRDGYLLVRADLPPSFHAHIYQRLEEVYAKEGNPGNNILPRVPEIRQVFEHPAVRGALESLLGPDYIMNPHRHGHLNPPGGKGQNWHKDCYVFDHNMRHPRFHWLLAFYYPQEVSPDMGPSGLLPGTQFYEKISSPDPAQSAEQALSLCGPAGTVALVHFDAWHRATANTSERKRYMLKFQFARLREPEAASWNNAGPHWEPPAENREACLDVWHWLCGHRPPSRPANGSAPALLERLHKGSEPERLEAAFALGRMGAPAAPALVEALQREAAGVVERIEDKTPDNAHGTNPTACRAAQALVAAGEAAVPQLLEALADPHWLVRASAADVLGFARAAESVQPLEKCLADGHWWVRRNAAEALGRAGALAAPAAPRLVGALGDADRRVRRMAALALAQLGQGAEGAVPALQNVLQDEDRYNRFYAALALRRMPRPEAREALFDALFTARWCPTTSRESPY